MTGTIAVEVAQEAEAIRATVRDAGATAREVAATLTKRGVRRIHIIGNGTSYHSSLAAATFYRRLAVPGDPLVVPLTAGEFRRYTPKLGPGDVVVGISASGEFRDVVAVTESLAGRVPTVSIINVPGSTLDRRADYVVRSSGGPSQSPVMTKTFVSTLTAALLLVLGFLDDERASAGAQAILAAADDVEVAVAEAIDRVFTIATALVDYEHLFVVGSGNGVVAAHEAALKLKEIALVHAEAAESWEMATGGATIVGPRTCVVALTPTGPGRDAVLDVAGHAASWGARIVEVGPDQALAGAHLPLPRSATEDLAPLTAVAPVALLAVALAGLRGVDPEHPGWVERYHSQGLRHIVGVQG
jgi:glucosamine--fructose-6-phosphate aminotransferase (isomerizing)